MISNVYLFEMRKLLIILAKLKVHFKQIPL